MVVVPAEPELRLPQDGGIVAGWRCRGQLEEGNSSTVGLLPRLSQWDALPAAAAAALSSLATFSQLSLKQKVGRFPSSSS